MRSDPDLRPQVALPQLRRLKLTGGTVRISDDAGHLDVWIPRSGVVSLRFEGYASSEFGPAVIEIVDREIKRRPQLTVFNDLQGITGYEPSVRKLVTAWAEQHMAQLVIHCLIRSPVMAMGLEVSRLTHGGEIYAFNDRRLFQKAIERSLGSPFRRPPTS